MASNATSMLINQQLRRHANACLQAVARLHQSERLQEVIRASQVVPPAVVAAVARLVPEHRQLESAARRRIEEICRARLEALRKLARGDDSVSFEQARERLLEDVQCLRGHHPGPLHRVTVEIERLRQPRLADAAPAAPSPDGASSVLDSPWHSRPRGQ